MFLSMMGAGASPRVSRDEALSISTVQRGRNLLCSISTLPLNELDSSNRRVPSPLLAQIDPDIANVVTLAQTVEDLVFESIAWWRITEFGPGGFPSKARRLDPGTVSLNPPGGKSPAPLPAGNDPRGAIVYVDGREVPASLMIRFDSPNPAVLKVGGRAIKRALLLDRTARMYADDPTPREYFTPADGADEIDDDEIQDILSLWRTARKERSVGWVPSSMRHNTVNAPSPAELQLAELQKQATLDIANALGIDPEDLGVSTTSRTYANAVDRRIDSINEVKAPYMRAITDRLSMGDVTRPGNRVAFDLTDYMKSNATERWMTYEKGKALGVYTVNDIRRMEGLPPVDETAEPVSKDAEVDASAEAGKHFNAPNEHRFSFTDDEGDHQFAADTQKRTITGLALPYGKVTTKYGMKFRFRPGSLQYADVSRVKHYKDHTTPVGVALSLKDNSRYLMASLSVARGATGDDLLQLAEDKVYDGLSVGVDFSLDPDVGDVVLARDGVYDVLRADLREISTTAMPSFDDARVTKVAASRDGVQVMSENATSGQAAEAVSVTTNAAPAVTLSADQFAELMKAAANVTVPEPRKPADEAPAERQVVNPTRLTASVTEAEPYRFDRKGNLHKGTHDFSTDLIAAHAGDQAAHDRAISFVQARFNVATGDVNEANPTIQRPDLYVDQRQYQYPIWNAINKGSLDVITPFTFPKFNSASGLVGDHTEGTEPTTGSFTTTGQTVTPTAVSGKATINREVWDQGGNPQVSNLIWQKMEQGWYEALEAAAVAALDAVTPTAIALTAGGGTTGQTLDAELTAALAALQFVRGGFTMDQAFAQVDLYKALVAAQDNDKRRLYPAIGPNNALGTVGPKFAALDVNGVTFYPAWALAATGSVVASSYLFDSSSVHGWASVPMRLDITTTEVAKVHIGLWGYKATAISDLAGVREITYDPVP
jgi:phage head maturation protease